MTGEIRRLTQLLDSAAIQRDREMQQRRLASAISGVQEDIATDLQASEFLLYEAACELYKDPSRQPVPEKLAPQDRLDTAPEKIVLPKR